MRTTVTLDPDTEQLVRRRMAERGISFKQAVNDLIRVNTQASQPFRTRTFAMGRSVINLDRALSVAGELEDEELVRRMRLGS
ncbi:MAG: hypothetical protein V9G10_13340 [Candidatus Nanopelagicales bacterium]